jgi:hypothetical protein
VSGEIRREVRREIRRLRLGADPPTPCAVCGETDEDLLRRASERLVEFHHLAGEANDPDLGVFLCLTHHRRCTIRMEDAGVLLRHGERRSLLERLEAVLRGLAIFFELAGQVLGALADELAGVITELDRSHQGWREIDQS